MHKVLRLEYNPMNLNKLLEEFKCQRCKSPCCIGVGRIFLRPYEVDDLAKYKDMTKHRFKDRYTFAENGCRYLITPCPFYSNERNCTLHESKVYPAVCQHYPFNQAYMIKGIRYITVSDSCPGGKVIAAKYGLVGSNV